MNRAPRPLLAVRLPVLPRLVRRLRRPQLAELRRDVDAEVEEGVVLLGGGPAPQAAHLGLQGAAEHGGNQRLR